MTSIEKLQISNIRSFGPCSRETPNIIEFYKPLTLIVGHNGAGKTTVIECLKYATTGDVPPNSDKGQAFIRDPRVAGASEIQALIRLKFRNLKGAPVVVNRIIKVVQKTNHKLEYKTLDGTIKLMRNGETVSQSHRCTDIDQFIPTYMGVSKAILNNVIFCHQEESNWPLLEKAKVKQKFDDIFCATRYNKALDEIKNLKKTHTQKAKECKLMLDTVQAKKSSAERIQNEIVSKEKKVERFDEKLKTYSQKREDVMAILRRSEALEEEARSAVSQVRSLEAEEAAILSQLQQLRSQLSRRMTESYEELIARRDNFEVDLQDIKRQAKALQEKELFLTDRHEELFRESTREEASIAAEMQKVESTRKATQSCDQAIARFAVAHGMSQQFQTGPFSHSERIQFTKEAKSTILKVTALLEDHRTSAREAMAEYDSTIGRVRVSLSSIDAAITASRDKQKQCSDGIAKLNEEIQESKELMAAMDDLEVTSVSLEAEISHLRRTASDTAEDVLVGIREEIHRIDEETSSINQRLQAIHQLSALNDQVTSLLPRITTSTVSYENQFREILGRHTDTVGAAANCIDFQAKLSAILSARKLTEDSYRSSLESASRDEAQLSGQLLAAKTRLADAKNRCAAASPVSEDFPEAFSAAKGRVEKYQGEIGMAKAATVIYNRFVEESRSKESCPLCKRGLDASAHSSFLADMEKTLAAVPQSLEKLQRSLKRAQERVEMMEKQRGEWELIQQHRQAVKELEEEISLVADAHASKVSEKAKFASLLSELQDKLVKMTHDVSLLENVRREFDEVKRLRQEKERLETAISSVGETMSLQEAKDRLKTLAEKRRDLVAKSDTSQREMASAQKVLTEKLEALNVVKGKLLKAGSSSSTVESLRGKIKDLEDTNHSAGEALAKQLLEKESLEEELLHIETEASAKKRFSDIAERDLETKRDSIQAQWLTVNALVTRVIQQEPVATAEESLKSRKSSLAVMQQEISTLKESINALTIKKKQVTDQVTAADNVKRNILDHIRCKEMESQAATLKNRANDLREKQKERSGKKAEDILREKEAATTAYKKLQSSLDKLQAGIDIYHSEIEKLKRQNKEYEGIESEYKKMVIELNTYQMVCEDLDKYHRVLDKALMDYHTMKIEEINKSLKELWQTTYKGTDIDSIEIRADHEGNRSKPSYNYRVVMVKGDTELNMRGRCSAGQRVLASLVIRLALAEALGVNCGIIALDEPTTNLDRANVESFASALANLIDSRRRQSNFQLIVITHDEEFVQLLGRSENADYYWRVAKDAHQQSTLTKCDISELA